MKGMLASKKLEFGEDNTIAWHTYFGWAIAGGGQEATKTKPITKQPITTTVVVVVKPPQAEEISTLEKNFKSVWEIEHLGIFPRKHTGRISRNVHRVHSKTT